MHMRPSERQSQSRGYLRIYFPYPPPLPPLNLRIENRLRDCGMQPLDGQAKPSQARPGQNRASQLSPQKFKVRWENRENTRWQRPLNVVKQYIHRLYASYIGLYTAYTTNTIYNIYLSIDLLRLNKRFTFLWRRVESSWRCGVGNVERRGVAGATGGRRQKTVQDFVVVVVLWKREIEPISLLYINSQLSLLAARLNLKHFFVMGLLVARLLLLLFLYIVLCQRVVLLLENLCFPLLALLFLFIYFCIN